MDNSPVDFIAYYPYRDDASLNQAPSVVIPTVQTDASQAGCDLMLAKADNGGAGYRKTDAGNPALNFTHRLSKLTMNCKVDVSVGDALLLDDATVTIHGMYTTGFFYLNTGSLYISRNPEDITPRRLAASPAGFHGAYDAIIMPAGYAAAALTVDFILNGNTFTWNVGAIDFEPEHEYIYEVTITYTGVTANGTIKPWDHEVKGPVTAE